MSGSADKTVRVWNTATGGIERVLRGHSEEVYSVTFSPDGTRVVSGSYAGILLWDAAANWIDHVPPSVVNSVAFSHDGTRVVSGSQTDLVNIWNADTGELGLVLKGHSKWVLSVAFSRDGTDKELLGNDENNDNGLMSGGYN